MILQNWWYTTLLGVKEPICPPLKSEIKADVVIVGGGMAGLSAAMRLKGTGKKVVLLERNICGGSTTGKSAGFLTPDSELELSQLIRRFGVDGAKDIWQVATAGVELIASTIKTHDIQCDFLKQDSLFVGNSESDWRDIQEETKSRAELGLPASLYAPKELPSVLGSTRYFGGVRYPGTYGINPLLYAQGVKKVLLDHHVQIYEASEVTSIEDHAARTHLGSVTAQDIIFCSDKLKPSLTPYSQNVFHAQTFLAVSEPLEDEDVAQMFPEEPLQCWDTDLDFTYYRLTGDQRLLVGGENFLTTFAVKDITGPGVIEGVIRDFKKKFPFLEHVEFIQYWPGRIDTTRDLLPTVLRDEKHSWIHFVLGCVGLPWAAFCGDFAARHILCEGQCEEHKYYRYFSVERGFLAPLWLSRIFGKQIIFPANNIWAKYFQKT